MQPLFLQDNLKQMNRLLIVLLCGLHVLLSSTYCNAGTEAKNDSHSLPPVGTNLSNVTDWTSEWVFVDTFKMSRTWTSQRTGKDWGQGGPLNLDSNGWVKSLQPGQSADALMQWDGRSSGIPGKYTVLYDGKGVMKFSGSATVISSAPGRIVLHVDSKRDQSFGIILKIVETDPENYIKNIRVIRPGFESVYTSHPFHPLFLERIKNFKVLRFMDWQKTNNSKVENWSDRTTPFSQTQTGKGGVALEYMIELANTLNANPWFNMPHQASDDFVRQFAQMVKDRLKGNLKIYIEYSNEVWNGQFDQADYAAKKGLKMGLSNNGYEAQLRYQSQRSLEIFSIWQSVFGSSERLVRVLSSHSANSWATSTILDWKNAKSNSDAVAIAPYFCSSAGFKDSIKVLSMNVDQLLDYCQNDITSSVNEFLKSQYKVISSRGLEMIAYEGGQHLVGQNHNDQKLTNLFISANRNPRMKDLYKLYLNQWKTSGGKLFVNFTSVSSPSKYGSFGLLEYQDQDPATAPKYQAIMNYLENQSN